MILVNSFGGTATTMIIEQIRRHGTIQVFDGHTNSTKKYKHCLFPPNQEIKELNGRKITKVLYVYCDPIDAIKTFFRRREVGNDGSGMIPDWVTGHCRNMGGEFFLLNPLWGIDEYAEQHRDILGMIKHWENWNSIDTPYDVCFIKYDALWLNLQKIADFLSLGEDFVKNFPEKRERKNFNIDHKTEKNLLKTYGNLRKEIKNAPDMRIKNGIY